MMYTDNLQIHKFTKPVNPKGSQHWIFIGRTETEAPILWPDEFKERRNPEIYLNSHKIYVSCC